jgi:hypothetical protein
MGGTWMELYINPMQNKLLTCLASYEACLTSEFLLYHEHREGFTLILHTGNLLHRKRLKERT